MHRRELHQGWAVRPGAGPVPAEVTAAGLIDATVPGVVHTDLLAAGLIPDPFLDQNETTVGWIGRTGWQYSSRLEQGVTRPGERRHLVFDGLDTVATVALDGVELGQSENQHRSHRFDVTDLLTEGDHELTVTFAPQLDEAERRSATIGPLPHVNQHPYNAVRKMACNFGWDWGPDLVTAGIWRPVTIQTWHTARISAVRPLVAIAAGPDGTQGVATVHVHLDRAPSADLEGLQIDVGVGPERRTVTAAPGETEIVVEVIIDDVDLWWPRGYGAATLYPVTVTLTDAAGAELDGWQGRIGFRSIDLDTTPDGAGTPFQLIVNGRPVFVRGVNWIPDDPFPGRITRERYDRRLTQAVDAGVNLLRVWGGGIYEADDFYDIADEQGLLVWQDFLFACACYTEDEPLRSEVLAEATEAIIRLCPHPSLVLWNGGNENLWGFEDWGWKQEVGRRTWGRGYYEDLLPALLSDLDPTRQGLGGTRSGSPGTCSVPRPSSSSPNNDTLYLIAPLDLSGGPVRGRRARYPRPLLRAPVRRCLDQQLRLHRSTGHLGRRRAFNRAAWVHRFGRRRDPP